MKAIQYDEPRSWELRELPTPEPGAGEVLVRILLEIVEFDRRDFALAMRLLQPGAHRLPSPVAQRLLAAVSSRLPVERPLWRSSVVA